MAIDSPVGTAGPSEAIKGENARKKTIEQWVKNLSIPLFYLKMRARDK
jgi:hypothetical protein